MRFGNEALILSATSVGGPFSSYRPEASYYAVLQSWGIFYLLGALEGRSWSTSHMLNSFGTLLHLCDYVDVEILPYFKKRSPKVPYQCPDQRSQRRCHELKFREFFNNGSVASEIRMLAWSTGSYDDYLFPNMIGGLAVLYRMKYLAFKRVLFRELCQPEQRKENFHSHTFPGNEGMYPWPPLKPIAKMKCFTLKTRSVPFCCLIVTDHNFVVGSWVELITVDEVQTFNSIASA